MFFDVAMIGFGVNIAMMLYMTVYLPYVKRIEADFETHCPQLIPVVTLVGILSFISYVSSPLLTCYRFVIAMWPVWGIFTPILMVILFMGYTFLLIFLPGGFIGTLVCLYFPLSLL